MFVVVKELLGVPGLPVTQKGIREALKRYVATAPECVRKRQGTKAFEYHIDCLPVAIREQVRQRHYAAILAQSGGTLADVVENSNNARVTPSSSGLNGVSANLFWHVRLIH